jgi:hypothetical protein
VSGSSFLAAGLWPHGPPESFFRCDRTRRANSGNVAKATSAHRLNVLHDKRRKYGWTYGDHFFPHDIKVREFTSGKSRLNTLAGLGIEATVVPQYDELDGINVVRRMLGRIWIDPVRCERGLEALRGYRREYDERLRDWKKMPLHSWESHGCDALRYFATGFDDTPSARAPRRRDSEPPSGRTHWSM